jgi:hypothetical protein
MDQRSGSDFMIFIYIMYACIHTHSRSFIVIWDKQMAELHLNDRFFSGRLWQSSLHDMKRTLFSIRKECFLGYRYSNRNTLGSSLSRVHVFETSCTTPMTSASSMAVSLSVWKECSRWCLWGKKVCSLALKITFFFNTWLQVKYCSFQSMLWLSTQLITFIQNLSRIKCYSLYKYLYRTYLET